MSDYLDRIVYEAYAQQHHEYLIKLNENERLVRGAQAKPKNDQKERRLKHGFKPRLAYIVAIILLATFLITQVVIAAINGSGGGGTYLVR